MNMLNRLITLVKDTPNAEISASAPIFLAITKQFTAAGAALKIAVIITSFPRKPSNIAEIINKSGERKFLKKTAYII